MESKFLLILVLFGLFLSLGAEIADTSEEENDINSEEEKQRLEAKVNSNVSNVDSLSDALENDDDNEEDTLSFVPKAKPPTKKESDAQKLARLLKDPKIEKIVHDRLAVKKLREKKKKEYHHIALQIVAQLKAKVKKGNTKPSGALLKKMVKDAVQDYSTNSDFEADDDQEEDEMTIAQLIKMLERAKEEKPKKKDKKEVKKAKKEAKKAKKELKKAKKAAKKAMKRATKAAGNEKKKVQNELVNLKEKLNLINKKLKKAPKKETKVIVTPPTPAPKEKTDSKIEVILAKIDNIAHDIKLSKAIEPLKQSLEDMKKKMAEERAAKVPEVKKEEPKEEKKPEVIKDEDYDGDEVDSTIDALKNDLDGLTKEVSEKTATVKATKDSNPVDKQIEALKAQLQGMNQKYDKKKVDATDKHLDKLMNDLFPKIHQPKYTHDVPSDDELNLDKVDFKDLPSHTKLLKNILAKHIEDQTKPEIKPVSKDEVDHVLEKMAKDLKMKEELNTPKPDGNEAKFHEEVHKHIEKLKKEIDQRHEIPEDLKKYLPKFKTMDGKEYKKKDVETKIALKKRINTLKKVEKTKSALKKIKREIAVAEKACPYGKCRKSAQAALLKKAGKMFKLQKKLAPGASDPKLKKLKQHEKLAEIKSKLLKKLPKEVKAKRAKVSEKKKLEKENKLLKKKILKAEKKILKKKAVVQKILKKKEVLKKKKALKKKEKESKDADKVILLKAEKKLNKLREKLVKKLPEELKVVHKKMKKTHKKLLKKMKKNPTKTKKIMKGPLAKKLRKLRDALVKQLPKDLKVLHFKIKILYNEVKGRKKPHKKIIRLDVPKK